MRIQWTLGVLAALLAGCPARNDADGGPPDAAALDAAALDAAGPDARIADARPTDASDPDAGPDAAPLDDDGGPPAPRLDQAPPPLFDGRSGPIDLAAVQLVDGWRARPTDEAQARAQAAAVLEARRTLEAAGPAAADRIAQICDAVPVFATRDVLVCLRLLSLVESPASLDLLAARARLVTPPWPEGAHPHEPAPEDLARQLATWALGQRARAGSEPALDLLLTLVAEPNLPDRDLLVDAVFGALPRMHAKARLRAALPADEQYRLYERR